MTGEKGRLACEARVRTGKLMGVKELIFQCIGQEVQSLCDERRSRRSRGKGRRQVAVPAVWIKSAGCLSLICIIQKRYLDTSIH